MRLTSVTPKNVISADPPEEEEKLIIFIAYWKASYQYYAYFVQI